jgi:hypothetical protein
MTFVVPIYSIECELITKREWIIVAGMQLDCASRVLSVAITTRVTKNLVVS